MNVIIILLICFSIVFADKAHALEVKNKSKTTAFSKSSAESVLIAKFKSELAAVWPRYKFSEPKKMKLKDNPMPTKDKIKEIGTSGYYLLNVNIPDSKNKILKFGSVLFDRLKAAGWESDSREMGEQGGGGTYTYRKSPYKLIYSYLNICGGEEPDPNCSSGTNYSVYFYEIEEP